MALFLVWRKGIHGQLEVIPSGLVESEDENEALEKIARHLGGEVIIPNQRLNLNDRYVQHGLAKYYVGKRPEFFVI